MAPMIFYLANLVSLAFIKTEHFLYQYKSKPIIEIDINTKIILTFVGPNFFPLYKIKYTNNDHIGNLINTIIIFLIFLNKTDSTILLLFNDNLSNPDRIEIVSFSNNIGKMFPIKLNLYPKKQIAKITK